MNLLDFKEYAKLETERVKNALPKLSENSLRFAFIADLHYKFTHEMRITVSNIIHAVNELNKTEKIDFLCLAGDNVGNYPASREEHILMMAELRALLEHCDVPVIFIQGNHDDNSIHGRIGDTNTCRTGFEVPDEVQFDTLFSISQKCPVFHFAGNKALYGYLDLAKAKTRVVFLNSSDVPYIVHDGIMKYNQQWDFGYSEKQLSWLANTALKDAPENVMFIEHMPFDHVKHPEDLDSTYNYDALDKITQAFETGSSVKISSSHEDFGYNISADFSAQKHNVPARISAHCHTDTQSVDKAGFLSITTMLAGRKNSGMGAGDDGIIYEREPFSATETSMDIFTFDPDNYTLSATRYGSGKDRTFSTKKRS